MLIVGGIAMAVAVRGEPHYLGIFGALAVASVFFYFFVNVRDHQDVYVGWRVGHFLFMSAAVLIGALFNSLQSAPGNARALVFAVSSIVFLAGLPTSAIDIYNTQDTTNHGEMPAGHWTLRLHPDDLQIFDWIRHNTDPKAIVPGRSGDARSRALGLFTRVRGTTHGGRDSDLDGAAREIPEGVGADPLDLRRAAAARGYERAVRARVNYILVGPQERGAHPGVEDRFDGIADRLPLVFKNGTISIYEVR